MKKIFFTLLFCLILNSTAQGEFRFYNFKIEPKSLFVNQEGSVLFSVQLLSSLEKQASVFLIEVDKSGELIRYHWPLKDDGSFGDIKAGDGVYSRTIQFKEKSPKQLHFLVTSSQDEEKMKQHAKIEELNSSSILKADLEITPRPSFLEIMAQIWKKIKER